MTEWNEETRDALAEKLRRARKHNADGVDASVDALAAALEEIERQTKRADREAQNARCYANELPSDPDLDGPVPVEETVLYKAEQRIKKLEEATEQRNQAIFAACRAITGGREHLDPIQCLAGIAAAAMKAALSSEGEGE
jgi:hypothetical protein